MSQFPKDPIGCRGDVLLALSTSGGSANILAALRTAREGVRK